MEKKIFEHPSYPLYSIDDAGTIFPSKETENPFFLSYPVNAPVDSSDLRNFAEEGQLALSDLANERNNESEFLGTSNMNEIDASMITEGERASYSKAGTLNLANGQSDSSPRKLMKSLRLTSLGARLKKKEETFTEHEDLYLQYGEDLKFTDFHDKSSPVKKNTNSSIRKLGTQKENREISEIFKKEYAGFRKKRAQPYFLQLVPMTSLEKIKIRYTNFKDKYPLHSVRRDIIINFA